jgi:hypothetical protein
MQIKAENKGVFYLLRSSIYSLITNKAIFFPYCIIIFFQLLLVEIIFFSNQFPLNNFLGPVIKTLWGEKYLHYPLNLYALPQLFQEFQVPLFIFFNTFFIAVSIGILVGLNNGIKIRLKSIYKETFGAYVHLVIASILISVLVILIFKFYGKIYLRAEMIRSDSGPFFILKRIVQEGAPYFSLFTSVLVTTLFAFVFPIIIVDRKKIFAALFLNFKLIFKSFWMILGITLTPTLLFALFLILRSSIHVTEYPEIQYWLVVAGIILMALIDATVYTALTLFYLLHKESAK